MGTVCKGTDKNVVACLNLEFLNYFVQIIETYAVKQIMFFKQAEQNFWLGRSVPIYPLLLHYVWNLKKGDCLEQVMNDQI